MYTLLIGNSKSITKNLNENLTSNIPLEMLQHKFLMHPTRLAMMKLMFTYERLTSTEIKSTLQISWSEFQSHIRALEAKLFVSIRDEFDEGIRKQFVYLEPQGMQDYQNLIQMLEKFVKPEDEAIGAIIIEDPEFEIDHVEENLYPKNKE